MRVKVTERLRYDKVLILRMTTKQYKIIEEEAFYKDTKVSPYSREWLVKKAKSDRKKRLELERLKKKKKT